jgi:anti-sigma B factor antagonist
MDGQHPGTAPTVITLPSEIDYANAADIARQLAAALTHGTTTVIADLTDTTFCDTAGLGALIDAHRLAITLTMVIPPALTRIFALTGLHHTSPSTSP